jgi:hypothetical protein
MSHAVLLEGRLLRCNVYAGRDRFLKTQKRRQTGESIAGWTNFAALGADLPSISSQKEKNESFPRQACRETRPRLSIQWNEVTERVRQMTRATTPEEIREVAAHIGVAEPVLQAAIVGRTRLASIKVIAALVRRGIDARYMLTGDVDPSLMRRMLEREPHEVEDMVKKLIADLSRPGGADEVAIGPH